MKELPRNPFMLGVTGGIACGKSTIALMIEDHGVPIIDFDVLGRQVVEPDRPAYKDIVSYFGEGILNADASINRKALSAIVFSDPDKKRILESFTHPRIFEAYRSQLDYIIAQQSPAIIQLVIPLLFEAGLEKLVHKILVVSISPAIQLQRLMARDGISESRAQVIINSQMPIERKKEMADFVIDNSGTIEETRKQVEAWWRGLDYATAY